MGVLFSQNLVNAEFPEIKFSRNGVITLSFTDVGKSCQNGEF